MEGEKNENNDEEIHAYCIRIKVHGFENIVPTYPVAEVSMKLEFQGVTVGESEKIHIDSNDFVPTNYEIILPCDLSSPDDCNKYISHPVTITIIETPKKVDMTNVQILAGQEPDKEPVLPTTLSISSKSRSSSRGEKKTKDKKKKDKKASKLKKAKDYFDTKPDEKPDQLTAPLTLGVAMLDLMPIFMGKTEYSEALYIRPVEKRLDEKAVALQDITKLQVTVSVDGLGIDEQKSSVFQISVESIYNAPSMIASGFQYQLSIVLPLNSQEYASIPFNEGTYIFNHEFIQYKLWPQVNDMTTRLESTYRINNEMDDIINNDHIDLESSISTTKPRIEYNTIKRVFLNSESKERIFKQILKYRKIPVEIYITPAKEEAGTDINSITNKRRNAKHVDKKDKSSKGKSSTVTNKSKKTIDSTEDEPVDYLHLMAVINVDQLLYPGVQSCRVACPIRTYHEQEILKLTGTQNSIYRPKPVEILDEEIPEKKEGSKKDKSSKKDKASKKASKASKASKDSKSSNKSEKNHKGKKGKKDQSTNKSTGIDLAQKLPPGPPPEPEPSKQVYNDKGEPSFILLEFEFIKPLCAKRKLEDLTDKLSSIITATPKLPKNLVSSTIAQEMYNETIRTLTKDMNSQYNHFVDEKKLCQCEHTLDFISYLQQTGTYQTYLATIIRTLATLIPEKYQFINDNPKKYTREYQALIKEVHTDMVEQMNRVINELTLCSLNKQPHKHMIKNEQLLLYAKEATELDEYKLAERYYLERICCNENNANCWFDYAIFQMELQNVDKSIECLKEVLLHDSTHRHGLLMYGLILLEKEKIAEAETCLLTMTLMHPRWTEGWGALFVYYSEVNNVEGMELTLQMAHKYFEEPIAPNDYFYDTDDLAWSTQSCSDNIYLKTAVLLIKMRLYKLAEKTLTNLMPSQNGQREYLLGVIAYFCRNYEHSLEHLKVAKTLLGCDYGVAGLIAHCFVKMDNHLDALAFYEMVLPMYNRPDDIHLVYLFGAICYDVIGSSQKARKLALCGCKYSPTPQTWMHAGSYYFKQNDFLSAEECLTQANLCDNRLPDPWAYLALINAQLGKEHEAELSLTQAKKFNGDRNSSIIANVEKIVQSMKTNQ